jgi:hypothetical protein
MLSTNIYEESTYMLIPENWCFYLWRFCDDICQINDKILLLLIQLLCLPKTFLRKRKEFVDWNHQAQGMVLWWALVNMIMNLTVRTRYGISWLPELHNKGSPPWCEWVGKYIVSCYRYWYSTLAWHCWLHIKLTVLIGGHIISMHFLSISNFITVTECYKTNLTAIFAIGPTYAPGPSHVHVTVSSLLG